MLIKDPSRFIVRNADSHDCVQLYQMIKQCHYELKLNDRFNDKLNSEQFSNIKFNQKNLKNNQYVQSINELHRVEIAKVDLNNCKNTTAQTTLENFEEFVDCLGFGKSGKERRVLECLLIEDLEERTIIGFLTFSYGYFSYNGKEIHLNHFYIRPDYRLNGFGKLLFSSLIKIASDLDLFKIKVDGKF